MYLYRYIYIYRRANGIYITKVAAYGQFVLVDIRTSCHKDQVIPIHDLHCLLSQPSLPVLMLMGTVMGTARAIEAMTLAIEATARAMEVAMEATEVMAQTARATTTATDMVNMEAMEFMARAMGEATAMMATNMEARATEDMANY